MDIFKKTLSATINYTATALIRTLLKFKLSIPEAMKTYEPHTNIPVNQ